MIFVFYIVPYSSNESEALSAIGYAKLLIMNATE